MRAADLAKLIKPTGRRGEWYDARCPAHDDRRPSFSFCDGDARVILECRAGCSDEAITAAIGLTVQDLFFEPASRRNGHHPKGREVETYDYTDEDGAVLSQAVRYFPKGFSQRRPDGAGGWINNLTGVRRVPYRLLGLQGHTDVLIPEGERDVNNLWHLGFAATTNAMGAGQWVPALTSDLVRAGVKRAVILPDNDQAGRDHARDVARQLVGAGIAVKVIELPGLPDKGDVSDWIEAGGTRDQLLALIAAAPESEAPVSEGPKMLIGAAIATAKVIETEWIVEALFSSRHQHMLLGASESAKTWALFALGLAISHPSIETFLGQRIRQHGRVVIESWEQDQAEDVRRLHKLARGHGLAIEEAFENLILLSETPTSLNDPDYFARRLRELTDWGAVAYGIDSLSLASGIDLNDNTQYTAWWQTHIRPIQNAGIMVVTTHLSGHAKPGVGRTRDSVVRGATQIRALSTQILEFRQHGDTSFAVHHNKHRNSTGLKFGTLTLDGALDDPWCRLTLTADQPMPEGGKDALARQKLLALGESKPGVWLTIDDINKALSPPDAPPKDRVSSKTWRPVIDTMTAEKLFQVGKAGRAGKALAWQFLAPTDPQDDEMEDEPSLL